MAQIQGASVWEQQLYDHVTAHGKDEGEILRPIRISPRARTRQRSPTSLASSSTMSADTISFSTTLLKRSPRPPSSRANRHRSPL